MSYHIMEFCHDMSYVTTIATFLQHSGVIDTQLCALQVNMHAAGYSTVAICHNHD